MALPVLYDAPCVTLIAGATLARFTRVTVNSSNVVVAAGATDFGIGFLDEAGSVNGSACAVRLNNAATHIGIANEAIAVGSKVYAGASGKVTDTAPANGIAIGTAGTAAAADGDEILIYPGGYDWAT
ncbi:MAG: hypothetical protein E6Q97_32860 [Desulfurellales bacterium]|nr:MAG: hypothetical protein E6Q97_32860 [Desulfurellales bacterium]